MTDWQTRPQGQAGADPRGPAPRPPDHLALGLHCELALGLSHRVVGRPDAATALEARDAGLQLEPAHLLFVSDGCATARVSRHQNRQASLRADATIAIRGVDRLAQRDDQV